MTTQMGFSEMMQSLYAGSASLDYRKTGRLLREMEAQAGVRVALMGNVTLDLLTPFLRVEAAKAGQVSAFHVGPFGQYMQDLHGEALQCFDPHVIVLLLSAEVMRPDAFARFHQLSVEDRHRLRDDMVAEIEGWIDSAVMRTTATLMVANFPCPSSALGVADLSSEYGEREFFLELNLALIRAVRARPRAMVLDVVEAMGRVGARHAIDRRMHYLAGLGWTDMMMREFGAVFAHALVGALGAARKCLVLDLDNSLWGGVVGEDGPHGIRVGRGDMVGEAFRAFQLRIKALKERGIMLALCSKNNPEDIEEVFRLRTDMPLQLSDMAATAIGWDTKYAGIEKIANQLNIGLDALVFLDDNAAEIAAVRQYCPDVHAVLLPSDPSELVDILDALPWFEKSRLTAEDRARTEQYALAAKREALCASCDPMDYLRDLDMRAAVRDAGPGDLLRVHQLFNKTNQFNLTTGRPTMGEVEAMMTGPAWQLIVADLRDRFGELGTVAICALRREDTALHIAHLLMSCRAMGRGLEHAMMNEVKRRFLESDAAFLRGSYVPTAKNDPVRGFFDDQGFAAIKRGDGTDYALSRADVAFRECDWIMLETR
jgi:FkbH-like protein